MQLGRSSVKPPPAISGEGGRSIRAQEGKPHLIIWSEGIVCIGKHKSKVRTIEIDHVQRYETLWIFYFGKIC